MASPPFYEDLSPSGTQDRCDRENSSHKRRRLTSDTSPPGLAMTDPYQATSSISHPEAYYQPGFFPPVVDGFPNMSGDEYWQEQLEFAYLVANSGPPFAQYARSAQPPTMPTSSPGSEPTPAPHASLGYQALPMPPGRSVDMFSLAMHLPDNTFRDQPHLAGGPARSTFRCVGHNEMRAPVATENQPTQLPPNASVPSQMNPIPPRRSASTSVSTPSANNKNMIKLVLSRATSESIEELDELKKECPACQLDFEPDNFMATISCCATVMHATCLSAWVNSQTYQKNRACMKCRKSIDARRPLNTVVPPVTDQNWDEGADLNAPESLKGDTKIELNVTGRPVRSAHRHIRGAIGYLPQYRGAMRGAPFASVDPTMAEETRAAIDRARNEHFIEMESMKNTIRASHEVRRRAADDERTAARALLEAQTANQRGGVTMDIVPLAQKWEETKALKKAAEERYCNLQRDMEFLQRSQYNRLTALAEAAWAESARPGGRDRERERVQRKEEGASQSVASSASASAESKGGASAASTSP
ncbi:hypothetical protein LTS17_012281 [Exophiala oligosperma]